MKISKLGTCAVLQLFLGVSFLAAQQSPGMLEIRFPYTRQGGMGSNQFAVWVEDAEANLVKTLYVTRFTAQGGWKRRPESIPQWVGKSGVKDMKKAQYDAISGATPRSGELVYVWDGTDGTGKPVPRGQYTVYVEASLRSADRVLYTGSVILGDSASESEAVPRYWGDSAAEREMIGRVILRYKPK